ncbi:hypothetical protein MBAV_002040 [Candidatus Magnetobacterium bavaricum]|uniref:Uncharacterized protein n=1 Tax=Candidatus Magnetobacterium bavaricum TaxID=29290 RepID=A0A0F3GV62_9BACT|nr:hypothetical protein MBAV_002040 [Candidatus Magnetobacterium bavaricum]
MVVSQLFQQPYDLYQSCKLPSSFLSYIYKDLSNFRLETLYCFQTEDSFLSPQNNYQAFFVCYLVICHRFFRQALLILCPRFLVSPSNGVAFFRSL